MKLYVLTRREFNFYVRSSPLRVRETEKDRHTEKMYNACRHLWGVIKKKDTRTGVRIPEFRIVKKTELNRASAQKSQIPNSKTDEIRHFNRTAYSPSTSISSGPRP